MRPALPIVLARARGRRRLLLYLVPIALTGCELLPTREAARTDAANTNANPPTTTITVPNQPSSQNSPATANADPNASLSGFHSKVTKEQRYNVHLELGRFQEVQENFELALSEYEKALEACETRARLHGGSRNDPQRAVAHRRIGAVLDRLGRFEQSEVHYQAALELSPDDPKVWNDAGYSYYLQGRWADAERALKTADSFDPNNTRILTNLGLTLAASGRTDDALAAFTRAGGKAVGHANLAYILAAMGKHDLAKQHYRTALGIQPELGAAKLALEALESRTGVAGPNQALIAATNPPVAPTTSPPVVPATNPPVVPATNPPVAVAPVTPPPVGQPLAARPSPGPQPQPLPQPRPVGPTRPARTGSAPALTAAKVPTDSGLNRASTSVSDFEASNIPPPVPPRLGK